MMKFRLAVSILAFFLFTNCGFELTNFDKNFNIIKIDTTGEKRINYKLRNKILNKSKNENPNNIEIMVNTKKERVIKEKNISNQITKYEIIVVTEIRFQSLKDSEVNGSFSVTKRGDYSTSSKYSGTLNNEKNLINSLIEDISNEIIENLAAYFDDL